MLTLANIYTSLPWNNFYGWGGFLWYLLLALGLFQVFSKAGEQGWKAIIPIYNLYICFKISRRESYFWLWGACTIIAALLSWMSGFWLFFWVQIVAWIFSIGSVFLLADMWFNLSVAFGHGFPFALGLTFLNPIFIMILGYGGDQYRYGFRRY
ncbi:DUF5684 domain-containing protein [Erysipelotrichaceae bacterium 51-3]|uniref:DUF5684 domain-containing protein n=1 Tax=Allobaculum sp. JKK-2023 TaxID=3108943 RepID=UPI002B05F2F8|nr:DUF5684 domain-containing protein [Allobaculum sp. JKK-2023]